MPPGPHGLLSFPEHITVGHAHRLVLVLARFSGARFRSQRASEFAQPAAGGGVFGASEQGL